MESTILTGLAIYLAVGEALFLLTLLTGSIRADWEKLRARRSRLRASITMFVAFNIFVVLWPGALFYGVRKIIKQRKA